MLSPRKLTRTILDENDYNQTRHSFNLEQPASNTNSDCPYRIIDGIFKISDGILKYRAVGLTRRQLSKVTKQLSIDYR